MSFQTTRESSSSTALNLRLCSSDSDMDPTDSTRMTTVLGLSKITQRKVSAFECVPTEILLEVSSKLSIFDKFNLQATCKRLQRSIQWSPGELDDIAWLNQFRHHNYYVRFDEVFLRLIRGVDPLQEAAVRQAVKSARETEFLFLGTASVEQILVDSLSSIIPPEVWMAKTGYSKRRASQTDRSTMLEILSTFSSCAEETLSESYGTSSNPPSPISNSTAETSGPHFSYALEEYNDDWEIDNLLALILTKDGRPASDLYSKADAAFREIRRQYRYEPPVCDYQQFAEKLSEWSETLKIREFCVQARRTIQQEKADRPLDILHCNDDMRMIDLLTPLLKQDRNDIQAAMKQARKVNLLGRAHIWHMRYEETILKAYADDYEGGFRFFDFFSDERARNQRCPGML